MDDRASLSIKPETSEYYILSYLIRNRGERFSIRHIANDTEIDQTDVSETIETLHERGLVEQSEHRYYVSADHGRRLKKRLEGLDGAVQLFESAPTDDAYAETDWETELPSIDD